MFGVKAPLLVFLVVLFTVTTTRGQTTTQTPPSTPCDLRSDTSCDECLKNVTCLWCGPTKKCMDYPTRTILPSRSLCPLADARWGLCWVNFQALIITMSVLAGLLIIAVLVCCFCCCRCEKFGNKGDDAMVERQDLARKSRHDLRRTEMKVRHDEIRQKYGLTTGSPYTRMDSEY